MSRDGSDHEFRAVPLINYWKGITAENFNKGIFIPYEDCTATFAPDYTFLGCFLR